MRLTLDLGIKRGKIACHKSEVWNPTAEGMLHELGLTR
uniref:Uncharacterized protein n=1 Tax=Cucumis melo TaxID=3656 RepID=A0A9I9ELD5_CUCME